VPAPTLAPTAEAATTAGGLPKRRRRAQAPQESAAGQRPEPASAPEPVAVEDSGGRSAEETARRIGAFARGTRHGRADRDERDGVDDVQDWQDLSRTPHEDEGNIQG
jgi:hypothetical protein